MNPKRVVIVEDNDDGRETLRYLLQLCGYEVEAAEDGIDGVNAVLAKKPRVAIFDIGLPEMDGYEAARTVRERLGDSVHLIALTGYGQPEDRARALAAGFDEHLVKPVDPEVLLSLLADLTRADR